MSFFFLAHPIYYRAFRIFGNDTQLQVNNGILMED